MAVITITGRVKKTGDGQYGPWAVVAETVRKQDGDTFEVGYMCSAARNAEAPLEGQQVVVTGFARAKVTERNDKHYADISISGAQFFVLATSGAADAAIEQFKREFNAEPITDADLDEVPF